MNMRVVCKSDYYSALTNNEGQQKGRDVMKNLTKKKKNDKMKKSQHFVRCNNN